MEFKKSFELTLKDFIDYNSHFARKRRILTSAILYPIVIAVVITGIIILEEDWMELFTPTLIIALAALVLIPFLGTFMMKSIARKQYESNKLLKSQLEIIINETGLSQSSDNSNTLVKWQDIYKADESKSGLYFYISKYQAFIIPKRLLTAEEQAAVYALIKKYLAPDKYRLLKDTQIGVRSELPG